MTNTSETDMAITSFLNVDVQFALPEGSDSKLVPSEKMITAWANNAYCAVHAEAKLDDLETELTIRLASIEEIQQLNSQYRHKDKPTNVLSFPVDIEPEFAIPLLGDVIICHSVLVKEAKQQNKQLNDHYAHMVTHGILHLCGYDHVEDDQANIMEALETKILATIGINDPYTSS